MQPLLKALMTAPCELLAAGEVGSQRSWKLVYHPGHYRVR
jgi:hypothetical protein